MEQLRLTQKVSQRQRWGYRFLKKHELEWLTSRSRLREQASLSLSARCQEFKRVFPTTHMNTALIRQVYRKNGIKKKKYRWFKEPKNKDEATTR